MSVPAKVLLLEVAEGDDSSISDLVWLARRAGSPKLAVAIARCFDVMELKKDHIHILAEIVINNGSPQQNRFILRALDRKLSADNFDRLVDRVAESAASSHALLESPDMIVGDEHEEKLKEASHRH